MKKTLLLKVDPNTPQAEAIQVAAEIIKKGGLVAFPTETVYGLGADALNPKAVKALFKAKKRPPDNPPIVHVGELQDVYGLVKEVPKKAEQLMKKFWPGPLTLIFKRSKIVPDETVSGLDTIAIRMPKHNVALALIKESGCPIAAPSANLAGRPSPTTAQHVLEDLDGRIDAVLDAGPTKIGVESTVLDLTADPPQILRPGGTPYEIIKEVLGEVELHPVAIADRKIHVNKARSPGMKHRHYAPKAKMVVVEGDLEDVIRKVAELADYYKQRKAKVGVLATDETATIYRADVVKSLGSRNRLEEIAQNLFRLLREFDLEGVDVIIAEGLPTEGLGLAVMNRLRKASGYRIVKVG
ncbi:MAG: L-threonylcarbamoyladenylate synthase [Candidatus Bathyarchaeota archaeon]|nr:L-threonylcarbamoyladenylate synthase [Candidatus Bathyarchaeota archaeon]MDW8039875.1 L-threonylcarbamoyladenylate synthase [Nitrososphaerota archaeon]